MSKTIAKSIEIHCEEREKFNVVSRIINYLHDNKDWRDGKIILDIEQDETVEVIFFDGCENVDELMEVLSI